MNAEETAAVVLAGLYLLDRMVKSALVLRFFAKPTPDLPVCRFPAAALIQPVTRGATNLAANLEARAILDYPGDIRHLIVCDAEDTATQSVCRLALPEAEIVLAVPDQGHIASKVAKMAAGVAALRDEEVLCFVDDDILLPPDALEVLTAPLYSSPPSGATFGLACQTSWGSVWESLISGFVNANALLGYVPLTFFTEPYTVTGHIFALRRAVFVQIGGMSGMARRFDDDHEIARRVRSVGLSCLQTPLVYQVKNALPSLAAYHIQMRRWFVMPRQAMVPHLTGKEQILSLLLGIGNILPSALLILAVCFPGYLTLVCALTALAAFLITYRGLESRYLPAHTPARRFILLPIVAFITPFQVLLALLLPGNRIEWRGQSYRAHRGGGLEIFEEEGK